MKITKQKALEQIEELKRYISGLDSEDEWIKIGYDQIPKETFDRYGAKPFEIMKRKMRSADGEVWNYINFEDAKKEAKQLGFRLASIQEWLVLMDYMRANNGKGLFGIEETSYSDDVCYEWIDGSGGFTRCGNWYRGADVGVESLYLAFTPASANGSIGFRCAR
jgi:hypothetical protein